MCYPVCGMVHIKEPLLLIGKSSPCGGSGFLEWSSTICPKPYNRKIKCVECVLLSFLYEKVLVPDASITYFKFVND